MKLYQNDITQRRERDGRITTWLSERLLTDELGISEKKLRTDARYKYLKSLSPKKRQRDILPDSGASWRYAKIDGQFYYDFDRLPANRKAALPGKEDLLQQYENAIAESSLAEIEHEIRGITKNGYKAFLHHYRGYDYDKALTLSKAAALISWIAERSTSLDSGEVCAFFQQVSRLMDRVGVAYVPRHWRRLKEKADTVAGGTPVEQVIDLPRKGNTNAVKFDDPEIISWLIQMRSLGANYTNAFIIRKLRLMCTLSEKKAPSKSWFESKLATNETKFLTSGRFGSGKLADRYTGYIPLKNALHAGDCWMADGTRVNMIAFKNADGKEEFLYWIAIIDVHSGDILGVHFDTKEDRWGYLNALNMAVQHAGYLPYEIVFDRFPGHNTEEIELLFKRLESLGTQVTISSSANSKAKLERLFETIQSVFMAESEWYYGEGVQSSRESAHRSPEYIARQKKRRNGGEWTFDDAFGEMMRVIDLYRTTKLSEYSSKFEQVQKSPADLHRESAKPHTRQAEIWETVQLFGLEKAATIRRNGIIRTVIQKVEYLYVVEAYEVIANYTEVNICYDMEDLSQVHVFERSDDVNRQFLCTATEQRRLQAWGPNAEKEEIGKAKARLKRLEAARLAHREQLVEQAGDEVDILLGPLAKKTDKASAETAWLEDRTDIWKDTKGKPRILNNEDADDLDEEDYELVPVNVRKQY